MSNRKNEVKDILMILLNDTEDNVLKIIETEKSIIMNESYLYWDNLQKNNLFFVNPYFQRIKKPPGIIINLHKQIIRMDGSLQNVKEENEELKIIKKNNELWADGWMRGVRF